MMCNQFLERERERETDRQTDRQTDRERDRERQRQINIFLIDFYVNMQPSCSKTRMEYLY